MSCLSVTSVQDPFSALLHLGIFILLLEYGSNSRWCYSAAVETQREDATKASGTNHIQVISELWNMPVLKTVIAVSFEG